MTTRIETKSPPKSYDLPIPRGTETVDGWLIGFASSQRDRHNHPTGSTSNRCSACRWSEVRIFLNNDKSEARYAVHTHGPTTIPGEINLCHLYRTNSAHQIVEILTVRKPNAVFLPRVAAMALAEAAGCDAGIEDAYINRLVK